MIDNRKIKYEVDAYIETSTTSQKVKLEVMAGIQDEMSSIVDDDSRTPEDILTNDPRVKVLYFGEIEDQDSDFNRNDKTHKDYIMVDMWGYSEEDSIILQSLEAQDLNRWLALEENAKYLPLIEATKRAGYKHSLGNNGSMEHPLDDQMLHLVWVYNSMKKSGHSIEEIEKDLTKTDEEHIQHNKLVKEATQNMLGTMKTLIEMPEEKMEAMLETVKSACDEIVGFARKVSNEDAIKAFNDNKITQEEFEIIQDKLFNGTDEELLEAMRCLPKKEEI